MKYGVDFFIEVQLEDRFLGVEINFWISCSFFFFAKSEIPISN